jgi:hypothetical protein
MSDILRSWNQIREGKSKKLKSLPADVGLFPSAKGICVLPHPDSRWINASPASNSGQTFRPAQQAACQIETAAIPAERLINREPEKDRF